MKRSNVWMLVLILACLFTGGVLAQLQQSGGPGSTVTVGAALPAGSNIVGKFGIDQTTQGTTNGIVVNSGTLTAVTSITNALPAGTNLLGSITTIPKTSCGTTNYDSGPTLLPTSSTAVTSTTTCVLGIYFTNNDTAAHTVTVTDGSTACASAACTYIGPAFSIPAASNMMVPLQGMKLTTGIKWNVTDSSTNKVMAQAFGFQ